MIFYLRCVTDGYCSLEQADLIQSHLEKKIQKIYKIDEILGKSLSKSLVNYDDNEDEMNEDDNNTEKKSSTSNNDENNHSMDDEKTVPVKTSPPPPPPPTDKNKNGTSNVESTLDLSSSSTNINNQTSPSSPKSNLSPGEIKPISPSSLSEASPTSN